jgi:hypothetical protein
MAGAGAEPDQIYAAIPAMWASQLAFYPEFSSRDYTSVDEASFALKQRRKMRTVRGVTYIECPDEYFIGPESDELYAYMWAKEGIGAETPFDQESPEMNQIHDKQGKPWLMRAMISGAAVGIQGKLVKRLHLKKITAPERPIVRTQAVT